MRDVRTFLFILIFCLSTHSHKKEGRLSAWLIEPHLFSHPEFHKKFFEFIIKVLLENDYPLEFIFNINERLKCLINNQTKKQNNDSTVTYVPFLFMVYDFIGKNII